MIGRAIVVAAMAALAFAGAAPSIAQSLGLGGSGQPIEILAREGIEWHRDTQRYIARGDAKATQGTTVVEADTLTAFYRDKNGGGTEIYRYEAEGNARIATPTQQVVGDKAVFDVDSGVLVMTGRALKLTTPSETVTARDSLEFWEQKKLAVARGDALVISADRRMKADLLSAYFVDQRASPPPANVRGQTQRGVRGVVPSGGEGGEGGERNRLQRIEGFGNVHVSTPSEVARGDRGVYNADTGIATLAGSVRITRGDNQLNGDYAEIDLNTGISRLLSRPQAGGDGRVRGLFVPDQRGDGKSKSRSP